MTFLVSWRSSTVFLILSCTLASTRAFLSTWKVERAYSSLQEAPSNSQTCSDTLESELMAGIRKMEAIMTPSFYEEHESLAAFYKKLTKNVEVKESSIPDAGLGLFAKKPLKANTIVSFYPAHALGIDGSDFVSLDTDYFAAHPSDKSSYLHCTDQPLFERPSFLPHQPIVYLDVNPTLPQVPGWTSPMINDGATVTSNTEAGVLDYYQQSRQARNCIHIPFGPSPVLATITTKKVKKGDELLTSYGGTYWLGVWLDVHGQEGVVITPAVQAEIQASARDLVQAMQASRVEYAAQAQALEDTFVRL